MLELIVLAQMLDLCPPGWEVLQGKQGYTCYVPMTPAPAPAQSWDQENLKRHDVGCPTAIFFVNPKTGLLEQCPP